MEGYNNHKKKLMDLINSRYYNRQIRGRLNNRIRNCSNIIIKDLDEMNEDSPPMSTIKDRKYIRDTIYMVTDSLIQIQFSRFTTDLFSEFLLLVNNWNDAVYDNKNIRNKILLIKHVVNQQLTISDSIKVMKQLIDESKNILRFKPEAYSLARHYVGMLEEEQKKDSE
jgi:hypothetical protein